MMGTRLDGGGMGIVDVRIGLVLFFFWRFSAFRGSNFFLSARSSSYFLSLDARLIIAFVVPLF